MLRARLLLPVVVVALLACAPAAVAFTPFSASQVTSELNAFRAEHGFPASVAENPTLSAGCEAHNRWMELNNQLVHAEQPGTPGYSVAGDAAAKISILAHGASWSEGNPWLNAPIHLADLLMPGMVETGASEASGRSCLATHSPTNLRAAPPTRHTFWAYPRDGAMMPSSQVAFEAPAPPQTFGAGPIADGVPTGPNIITFLRGPLSLTRKPQLTAATLVGPGGVRVPVMTVSERRLIYLPPGAGVIVPRAPLEQGATYTWTATYTAPRTATAAAFRFTSPPRSFTTTTQKLCGAGIGGWFATPCPVSVLRVSAPRRLPVTTATNGIRVGVTLDGASWAGATVQVGRRAIGLGSTTIDATQRGTITVRPRASSLLQAMGTRSSIVVTIQVKATSNYVRTVRVLLTR